eukprot:c45430_g1_i1.p1 GENE.c45430_g1_i1~~c45430_g1_i1.p1  ORF type:complete len:630 (-),score=130.06 c45430_g1_i1:59-1948(-)
MAKAKVHPEQEAPKEQKHAGPTTNRSCTDILVLILFIAFLCGMVVVASFASKIGRPERLVRGIDTYGNMCGERNSDVLEGGAWRDMTDKKLLFFGNPTSPRDLQICVKNCPGAFSPTYVKQGDVYCRQGYTYTTDVQLNLDTLTRGCFKSVCECFITYPSVSLVGRCLPAPSIIANYTASKIIASERTSTVREMLTDVLTARFVILACAGISLATAFIWLILLRLCGGFMVWTTLLAVLLLLGLISFLCLYFGDRAKTTYDKAKANGDALARQKYNYIFLLAVGAFFALLFLLMFFGLIFMRRRINLAVEIVKEAARTVAAIPSMLVLPLLVFIVLAGFIAAWIVVMLYLGTAGTPRYANAVMFTNEPRRFLEFKTDDKLRRLQGYHVFGGLWVVQFILAFNQISIAGAVAHHFFRSGPQPMVSFPLVTSIWYTVRYHLGSIAFGSLIIAIVQFVRVLLRYAEEHLKMAKDNDFVKFLLRCMNYCFLCLERFLKFISRNAYIMIAINGHNFCRAAKDAFSLLMANALRLMAVQFVTAFVIFLGKLVIICATGAAAFFWLRSMDLEFWAVPLVLILLISFAIAALFMSVFESAIDAIFLCVCEDIAHFDAKYMNEDLRAFVDEHNASSDK